MSPTRQARQGTWMKRAPMEISIIGMRMLLTIWIGSASASGSAHRCAENSTPSSVAHSSGLFSMEMKSGLPLMMPTPSVK